MERLFPELETNSTCSKEEVFQSAVNMLVKRDLTISRLDILRPWGFFLAINQIQSIEFAKFFFPDLDLEDFADGLPLQPKILGVAPEQRLSWQYHHRRSEIWRGLAGEFQIVQSNDDSEGDPASTKVGEVLEFGQGTRHRAIGQQSWGIIAEIWRHTDLGQPSDENDIVRLQDDYSRG
jgi:mannose-6-phosphate isomerase